MKTLFVLAVCGALCSAQVAEKANERYKTAEGRAELAQALDEPGRDERQKPRELVEALRLQPGMSVADLGTGPGYLLPFLSAAVGPDGKVIGEDIQTDFLDKAKAKIRTAKLANVSLLLGTETDPKLPAGSVDVVLALDVYHHFDYPEKMLANIGAALKAGGRFVIVDYYKRRGAMDSGDRALEHIRLDEDAVIHEVEANGYRLVSQHEHIPHSQYMAIFQKK